jgi:hypothetical protein
VTTSTSPTTTIETTTTTSSEPTAAGVRSELDLLLATIHPSDLKPKDSRAIMKLVDEAILLAAEGEDSEDVSKKLTDAAEDLAKKLEGTPRDQALSLLGELASILGVEIQPDSDED